MGIEKEITQLAYRNHNLLKEAARYAIGSLALVGLGFGSCVASKKDFDSYSAIGATSIVLGIGLAGVSAVRDDQRRKSEQKLRSLESKAYESGELDKEQVKKE